MLENKNQIATIRQLREDDLAKADEITRLAFGTFLGMPEPLKFMGDADFVRTRFRTNPEGSLAAEVDGKLVGSNFLLNWGSFGVFGPLTVHPEYWDKGIAKLLLDRTMAIFDKGGTRHVGLFTFAQSAKHVHLYQKFGFWPRFLISVMSKDLAVQGSESLAGGFADRRFSELAEDEKSTLMEECAQMTGMLFDGLDLRTEIAGTDKQNLGDTIIIRSREENSVLGIAICHSGPGTEAGSNNCYVKFAAVRPGVVSGKLFDSLLAACERYAKSKKATRLTAGANTSRHSAYKRMIELGFRTEMQGVAMDRPNEEAYNRPEIYAIDDWR